MLYQMKVVIFLEEMLSIIFTPFILWFSLPKCSDRLVDFFREFTVHVDGLGYVCSFAVFDFKKGAAHPVNNEGGTTQDLREEYYSTKDGKMLASYYGFIDNYVNNQRPGAPYLHAVDKQIFHPPPTFSGMMSSALAAATRPITNRVERRDLQQHAHGPLRQSRLGANHPSVHRTPRFAPVNGALSPTASVLLDPRHHAPSPIQRAVSRRTARSQPRAFRNAIVDLAEEEDVGPQHDSRSDPRSQDDRTVDESNLSESWKTTRAGNVEDDGDNETRASKTEKGPGVLGLAALYLKAQTEGKGTGVNI